MQQQIDAAQHLLLAVAHLHGVRFDEGKRGTTLMVARLHPGRRSMRGQPAAAETQPLLDRQRQRLPGQGLAHLHQRRDQFNRLHDRAWVRENRFTAARGQIENAVHKGQHALQAVLGQDHGQPQVVVEAHERVEHILSRLGIELRGRLVEHQDRRAQRQRSGNGHALAFAAGEGLQRAVAQRCQVKQVERFFDAHAHLLRGHGGVLQGKGDLIFDAVGDELSLWVLEDEPYVSAQDARGGGDRVKPLDAHIPAQCTAAEMGDQPIQAAQQSRLAGTRRADQQNQLALRQIQADVLQGRPQRAGIGVAHVLKTDHRRLVVSVAWPAAL